MVDKELQDLLFRIATEVANRAKEIAPVVTGNLRNDIQVFDEHISSGFVEVGNTTIAPYAKAVHFGTKPYEIRPKRAKALKTPYGLYKKVKHPGIKANPYLEKALDDVNKDGSIDKIFDNFSEVEEMIIRKLGLN